MAREIDPMDGVELAKILKEAETYKPKNSRASGSEGGFMILEDESPIPLPTARQREEFHNLLRFALDIIGAPPRGYEDDSQSSMERSNDEYERRKRQAKRKLEDVVNALNDMTDKYPSLKKLHKQDLDKLK